MLWNDHCQSNFKISYFSQYAAIQRLESLLNLAKGIELKNMVIKKLQNRLL